MINPADTAARLTYLTHRVDQLTAAVQDRDAEIARLHRECAALRWRLRLGTDPDTANAVIILGGVLAAFQQERGEQP